MVPGRYSPQLRNLLAALLAVEPGRRPGLPDLCSHSWLAPHIFRVAATVGQLPCTTVLPPSPLPSQAFTRRSPSPFLADSGAVTLLWRPGTTAPTRIRPLDPRAELVSLALAEGCMAGVESSGGLVVWPAAGPAKHLPGISGITITMVALGTGFCCLLTERGIILSRGEGGAGCLGHGDTSPVEGPPRIVEGLLGDDVVEVRAGPQHVAVLTADGEVFTWGTGKSGCLGQPARPSPRPAPRLLNLDRDICRLYCGDEATALLAPDGRWEAAGGGLAAQFVCRVTIVFFRQSVGGGEQPKQQAWPGQRGWQAGPVRGVHRSLD